ncbi:PREDICTED: taxadiene 5-alpha hydroxylase [Nelumbo nucifera]|uniref:Taxadiene 5-alpha hydroxylase n=2 Tax=Nelumbo nucifera TaxID=4432 RepID=A0A1U8BAF8_NELNU|nr:PREDICTED: taxadiene 5-alpha hydroxylase [Nelumbo nucifera]DAD37669.1 TPA_asm: hypothetical protein HUJ06_008310 [Nelumbo nucifera]
MALEMDSVPSLVLSVLAILVTLIFLMSTSKKKNSINRSSNKKLPPGEMGLPWIGETLEFHKAQRSNRLLEDFIQPRMTKHGNIFKTRLMGSPTVLVSGAEANKFFLSNEFKLVVSSWPSSSVQLMGTDCIMQKQGERHRCIRGAIASSLSCTGLEALVPKICSSIDKHLSKDWHGRDTVSLYPSVKKLSFSIVLECLLGIDVEPGMLEMFEGVVEGAFAAPVNLPGCRFWRAKKARLEIEKKLVGVVRRKREEMEQKVRREEERRLLSGLVLGLMKGEMSEKEVVDNVVLLVFAAHDTTSFAIAMICRMLALHPNCHSRLVEEHVEIAGSKRPGENLTLEDTKKMKYTWQVARESMRMFPPIFGSFRKAIVDIEYEGFTIPKGWKVLWTAYGTHYDSQCFPEPLHFNPSRFEEPIPPYAFVPFGGGPRLCAGYQLAKLNILLFLHFMVTHYDWSLLHKDETITADPLPFPSQGMPIKIAPKQPCK